MGAALRSVCGDVPALEPNPMTLDHPLDRMMRQFWDDGS
jgi:hypothetical protein